MTDASEDTHRAVAAMQLIFYGRDPSADRASILVTLEHVVAGSLLAVMSGNYKNAAVMLNEGLIPGVEARLALSASRKPKP